MKLNIDFRNNYLQNTITGEFLKGLPNKFILINTNEITLYPR